jgi:hypothetical protein
MKNKILIINGFRCEVIGASNNCTVFINDASHPCFSDKFTSIKEALNRFKSWAKTR